MLLFIPDINKIINEGSSGRPGRQLGGIKMPLILGIIGINVIYVSLNTLRTIFVIKGRRLLASLISMGEVFVYLTGLTIVLQNLDKPWNIVAYCAGYALEYSSAA
jgi:uncharacterized protein YebE (UPF0316 family)